jgi:hypothetical protein
MKLTTGTASSLVCHPERSKSPAQQAICAVEGPLRLLTALGSYMNRAHRMTLAVLKEIFDESAYARFLTRNQLTPSRASYAAFQNEHQHGQARRPRCC